MNSTYNETSACKIRRIFLFAPVTIKAPLPAQPRAEVKKRKRMLTFSAPSLEPGRNKHGRWPESQEQSVSGFQDAGAHAATVCGLDKSFKMIFKMFCSSIAASRCNEYAVRLCSVLYSQQFQVIKTIFIIAPSPVCKFHILPNTFINFLKP